MVSAEVAFAGVSGLVSGGVCAVFVLGGAAEEVLGCSLTCDTVLSGFAILELSADEPCALGAQGNEEDCSLFAVSTVSAEIFSASVISLTAVSSETQPLFDHPTDEIKNIKIIKIIALFISVFLPFCVFFYELRKKFL